MRHGFRRARYVVISDDEDDNEKIPVTHGSKSASAAAAAGLAGNMKRRRVEEIKYMQYYSDDGTDSDASGIRESSGFDSDDEPLVPSGKSNRPDGSPGSVLYTLMGAPTGEIAVGTELTLKILPEINIKNFGKLEFPITPDQACGIRKAAKKLRTKDWGAAWTNCHPKSPTWTVLEKDIKIRNDDEWGDYLVDLSDHATGFLGFRNERKKMSVELHGLVIWDKNSLFRSYSSKIDDPTRVGTLLVILNKDYTGGDIAIGCGTRDVLFQPEHANANHYLIASHAHCMYDVLPIQEGFRIALSYDIYLPKQEQNNIHADSSILRKFLKASASAEVEFHDAVTAWASRIQNGTLENFPVVYVLQDGADRYDTAGGRLDMSMLTARDRAKATMARMTKHRRRINKKGFKLQVYLAAVTATTKNYGRNDARRIKYAVERATDLTGIPKPEIARDIIVDERGVCQWTEFTERGEVRKQVSRNMTTVVRTRTVSSSLSFLFFFFKPSDFLFSLFWSLDLWSFLFFTALSIAISRGSPT